MSQIVYNFSTNLGLAHIDEIFLLNNIKAAILAGSQRNLLSWNEFKFQVNSDSKINDIINFRTFDAIHVKRTYQIHAQCFVSQVTVPGLLMCFTWL